MMRIFTRNIALVVAAFVMLMTPACGEKKKGEEDNRPPQTLIFYFTGTKLAFYFYRNISAVKDAMRGDILGKSRILYLFQNSSKTKTELFELKYEEGLVKDVLLQTYQLPSQMDEQTLSYIFKDVIRQAPSKSYGLVMAGHSTGWVPMDPESTRVEGSRIESVGGSAMQSLTHEEYWHKNKGEHETRYIGETYNSSSSHGFELSTLSNALSSTGVKFDYIIFDACFMSNVEALYDIRNNTHYAIGSPCEIMGDGFPYDKVIPQLMLNGGTSFDLDAVCRAYNQHYAESKGFSGSVALIDCTQLDALAAAMKKVNAAAKKDFTLSDVQAYEGHRDHIFFDLGDYVNKSCGDNSAAMAFRQQLNRTIKSKYTLDKFYSNYGYTSGYHLIDTDVYTGLTTSAPSEVYTSDYKQTAWYRATN